MELNSRCIQILRQVAGEKNGILSNDLIDSISITRRSLYYDLGKINDWLVANNLGKIETLVNRLYLRTNDPQNLERLLRSFSSYIFSVEERRAIGILYMALSASHVTSGTLQLLLDVSKNTILGDIKECKSLLRQFHLRIGASSKGGYYLEGEEIAVRKLIGQQLCLIKNEYPKSIVDSLLQGSLAEFTGNRHVDFHKLVNECLKDYERSLNTLLVTSDTAYPEVMILSACIRCMAGHPYPVSTQEKDVLKNSREYSAVLLVIHRLLDVNINLHMDEAFYITILILGVRNFDFNSVDDEDDFIRQFTTNLVDNFERIACVGFKDKRQFLGRLYLHIRPMYYRLKYGRKMGMALTHRIRDMYSSAYEFTRQALKLTSSEMSSLIDEEELTYLCIYMVSYLGERATKQTFKRHRILIICGAGVAASVLLREQISSLLGDAFKYDLLPARQVEDLDLSGYCLIITTIQLDTLDDRVIQTGPILSEDNKARITDIICRTGAFDFSLREAEDILDIVRKNMSITDETSLLRDIVRYCIRKECRGDTPSVPPSLNDFLNSKQIIRMSDAGTIEQAAGEVCKTLNLTLEQRKDCLSHICGQPMACSAVPGVALEYFQKSSGDIDMSIVVFRNPIQHGHQKTSIFIMLATVDNTTHFPILHELYNCFGDETLISSLQIVSDELAATELFARRIDILNARSS